MRITVAIGMIVATTLAAVPAAQAQSTAPGVSRSNAEMSEQSRRPRPRVRIYRNDRPLYAPDVSPRYNPGPNAVRVCNAAYVREYRPSGTVIVPHVNCVWRRG